MNITDRQTDRRQTDGFTFAKIVSIVLIDS